MVAHPPSKNNLSGAWPSLASTLQLAPLPLRGKNDDQW